MVSNVVLSHIQLTCYASKDQQSRTRIHRECHRTESKQQGNFLPIVLFDISDVSAQSAVLSLCCDINKATQVQSVACGHNDNNNKILLCSLLHIPRVIIAAHRIAVDKNSKIHEMLQWLVRTPTQISTSFPTQEKQQDWSTLVL